MRAAQTAEPIIAFESARVHASGKTLLPIPIRVEGIISSPPFPGRPYDLAGNFRG